MSNRCLMSDTEPLPQGPHPQAESLTAEPMPNAQSLDAARVNAQDSSEQHTSKFQRVEVEETKNTYLERDPGLRHQIGTYSVNQRDDIRREYIKMGPYQPKLRDYRLTNDGMQERRGHDESVNSKNRGNFIDLIKHSAECSKEIAQVVLENAPSYAKYTSSDIQKELLNILANKVLNKICKELGDGKFCILVDEALDESDKAQMVIILRYVDCEGYIREPFFEVVNVMETTAVTLKKEICNVLARYDLLVENIRWQGYNGASNMRGAWNGLQVLFLKDCPYAYYIHCFAHQLQLVLVAASNDLPDVWLFFSALGSIVNVLTSSAKRLSELKSVWEAEIIDLIASREVQTGTRANQIHTLQRPGATRWSSHFRSISRLLDLFSIVRKVLWKLVECGPNNSIRGEAKATTERAFSAMKLIKTTHRNKMENEFLSDCIVIYIEREIADNIDSDAIVDEFSFLKNHRTQLRQ
ncbi:TTF-type domain-containing protein [Citrus sinensis]|nr:TTF-type domain-containing protein [Citrus sinensis]